MAQNGLIATDELPGHTHTGSASSASLTGNIYTNIPPQSGYGFNCDGVFSSSQYGSYHTGGDGGNAGNGHIKITATHSHTVTISNTGNDGKHENRMAYEVVNRWKRTT